MVTGKRCFIAKRGELWPPLGQGMEQGLRDPGSIWTWVGVVGPTDSEPLKISDFTGVDGLVHFGNSTSPKAYLMIDI